MRYEKTAIRSRTVLLPLSIGEYFSYSNSFTQSRSLFGQFFVPFDLDSHITPQVDQFSEERLVDADRVGHSDLFPSGSGLDGL